MLAVGFYENKQTCHGLPLARANIPRRDILHYAQMWKSSVVASVTLLLLLCSNGFLPVEAQPFRTDADASSKEEEETEEAVATDVSEANVIFSDTEMYAWAEINLDKYNADEDANMHGANLRILKKRKKILKKRKKKRGGEPPVVAAVAKEDMTEEELAQEEIKKQLEILEEELKEDIADGEQVVINDDGDEIVEPVKKGPPPKKQAPAMIAGENRKIENIVTSFQLQKERMLEKIKQDYGPENFQTLFMDQPEMSMPLNQTECTIGRNAFFLGASNSGKAWQKTVRKMKLNLLQYMLSGEVQDFVWATA